MVNPNPSKNGHTVKQRDIMSKFKEWFSKMYVGTTSPQGKEVVAYFEDKYGKYPSNDGVILVTKGYEDVMGSTNNLEILI